MFENYFIIFTIHFATINTENQEQLREKNLPFTIQRLENTQKVGNIRFLDVFCVLTVHYSNRQI